MQPVLFLSLKDVAQSIMNSEMVPHKKSIITDSYINIRSSELGNNLPLSKKQLSLIANLQFVV